ncbi:MAG: glycosyltransferase family 4 protein [candidate division KSB1 bacterium]|nr:glycosyltransferase family 4 protein [candidate division KSB1 bacterium]
MRILYFNYHYDLWGGALGSTLKVIELFRALERRGHEVQMCWMNPRASELYSERGRDRLGHRLRTWLKARLARYVHEPNQILNNVRNVPRELARVRKFSPDLLICKDEVYRLSPLLTARITGLPWIVEGDAPSVPEYRQFFPYYKRYGNLDYAIEKAVATRAMAVFVQSNETKRYFLELGVPEERLRVIPNGADPRKFNPEISGTEVRRKVGLTDGEVVLGFVGSLHYWHGVDNLVRLVREVCASYPNAHFLIAGGGGPETERFLELVQETELGHRVHFLGYLEHDQMPPVIAALDIALAPYPRIERFHFSPVKLFEYMACAKPVVAARLGQIAEVIRDGENGMLFEPGDFADLLAKVRVLMENPQLRAQIGQQAYRTIVPDYTWDAQAAKLEQLCFEVLEKHRRSG